MPIVITDQFTNSVLKPLLIALFVLLAIPVTLILIVLGQTGFFTSLESDLTIRIIHLFDWFHGTPETVAGPFMQVLPALVTAICLTSDQPKLTSAGRWVFVIVVFTGVAAAVLLFLLNPEASGQAENISGGKDTLLRFVAAADYSLKTALTYFGLLTGFALKAGVP
jgi:hypothetical protein